MPVRTLRLAAPCAFAALLVACDEPPTSSPPPSVEFWPASVGFSTQQPGSTVEVRARVSGFGPTPALRWTSLAPEAVAVEAVRENGAVVVLRAAAPRPTGIVLQVTGSTTRSDTLPVTVR
jgi:hypothetical protein